MSWIDCYKALQRYDGEWRNVPYEVKLICMNRNPNDLTSALDLAKRKYEEDPNLFINPQQ